MPPVAVPKKEREIKAVVVEDYSIEAEQIESAFREIGIQHVKCFSNYDEANVIEIAKDADIVSLDLEVGGYTHESIEVAKKLVSLKPHIAGFFFTREPYRIEKNPFNFTIEKYKLGIDTYARVAVMMLAHNQGLSILHSINELLHVRKEETVGMLISIYQDLDYFSSSLSSMVNWFGRIDSDLASRYERLRSIIRPASEAPLYQVAHILSSIRQPLFVSVRDELINLRSTEGVHVRPELESEIRVLGDEVTGPRANEILEEISQRSYGTSGFEEASEHATDGTEIREEASTLYLNVWFPNRSNNVAPLIVDRPAGLNVNIGPIRPTEVEGGARDAISSDKSHLFYSIEFVDVLIICPGANVEPLSQRLNMPPGPNATVAFTLTPLQCGRFDLTVVILISNDPIHRSVFSFEAVEAELEQAPAITEERVAL